MSSESGDHSPDDLMRRVIEARVRLAPRFPDMDPGDLMLILQFLLSAEGRPRRFFSRRLGPDVHVI